MGIFVPKAALFVLLLTAAGVYAMHMATLAPMVGVAIGLSLLATLVPSGGDGRTSRRASVFAAAGLATLGLVIVWATNATQSEQPVGVLRDLGWSQFALGGWLTYSTAVVSSPRSMVHARFDDAARARWRLGDDIVFGADLAGCIMVGAQPSWVALVIEAAWPEPRPATVSELLGVATTANLEQIVAIRARMQDKGGTDIAEARWELARAACDVIREACTRQRDEVGGAAVGRFVMAAARVVRDDADATRIFAALVLPAIARRA
jgi:hypothetical protein